LLLVSSLLSTDVTLADEEIVKLYKRRWDIEVFFKITKSYPRLAKEFQSRSYDALVAHTTIVFSRYIAGGCPAHTQRSAHPGHTLFHAGCDGLRQASLAEALRLLLSHLEQGLKAFAELPTAPLRGMLEDFMAQIPAFLRRATLLPAHVF
jgi:hypothetical protein